MPQIRSITAFTCLTSLRQPNQKLADFLGDARAQFTESGYAVQTTRLAAQPLTQGLGADGPGALASLAQQDVAGYLEKSGADYLAIGPVTPHDPTAYLTALPDVLAAHPRVFAAASITQDDDINLAWLSRVAALIKRLSTLSPDGLGNLRFAALANCPPFSPFLPAAYHDGGPDAFALAIEAADIAVTAFSGGSHAREAAQHLTRAIEATAAQLVPLGERLAQQYGLRFMGLDFSLAPYPEDARSLGKAFEALGPSFGGNGLIAAASLIMNSIEAARFPSTGFSGLMLPVLEDRILGLRTTQQRLTISELLALSAVCGTGLDCIPLAGNVPEDALYALLLDVAALSLRLDKPLTARLMPLPDKKAGDAVHFDFEYFTDSRVMPSTMHSIRPGAALGPHGGSVRILPRG